MRAARRGQTVGSPPAYLFAPVLWSDTGNVFVFRPTWTINVSEDEVEEYFYASPTLNRLDGESPYSAVRKFTDAESAKQFLAKENAYPRRPRYLVPDGDIVETYYLDFPGPRYHIRSLLILTMGGRMAMAGIDIGTQGR